MMTTMTIGTKQHNAGVKFYSSSEKDEAPDCAIWVEETQSWEWADDADCTEAEAAARRNSQDDAA